MKTSKLVWVQTSGGWSQMPAAVAAAPKAVKGGAVKTETTVNAKLRAALAGVSYKHETLGLLACALAA